MRSARGDAAQNPVLHAQEATTPLRGPSSKASCSEPGEDVPGFPWDALTAKALHPVKVGIIEALCRLCMPLSATQIGELSSDSKIYSGIVTHHASMLAKWGVIEVVDTRQVRGATESFYFFCDAWRPSGVTSVRAQAETAGRSSPAEG
jgi:hypothetical protein